MAWLSGYQYRKQITITGTADGAQTNYQLVLTIVQGTGTDSGGTVYLKSRALDWPEDIRFTKSDGTTLLDFWREESDATDGTWWIEFDSIPISPNTATFYLYYGKASDTDASNIANTFIVGDDFERGNDGDEIGGSWTESEGIVEISTSQKFGGTRSMKLEGGAARPAGSCSVTPRNNIAIRFRVYKEDLSFFEILHSNATKMPWVFLETTEDIKYNPDAGATDTGYDCSKDAWGLLELNGFNWTTNIYDIWYNGTKVKDNAAMYTAGWVPSLAYLRGAFAGQTGYDDWIDDFIVRNWTANEPTWGTWGAEATGFHLKVATGLFTQLADTNKPLYYNVSTGKITTLSTGNKMLDINKSTGRLTAT